MKYKITLVILDREDEIFHITAKTDLSVRMKVNRYIEHKKINDGSVVDTIIEEEGDDVRTTRPETPRQDKISNQSRERLHP